MRTLRPVVALAAAAALAVPAAAHADQTTAYPRLKASVDTHLIAPGGSATITGTLLLAGQPYGAQPVKLLVRTPGTKTGYTATEVATTDESGAVAFTVTPPKRTVYRLKFPGADGVHSMLSHRMVVRVKAPTTLGIATTAKAGGDVIVGKLVGNSHKLARKPVFLVKATEDGWAKVRVKLTKAGIVRFALPSEAAGDYALRFPGTKRYLASTSSTVTLS